MERVAKPFSFFWNNHQQDKPVSVYSPYFAFKKGLFLIPPFVCSFPFYLLLKFVKAQRSIKTNCCYTLL